LALLEVFAGRSGPKVETIPDVAKAAAHLEKFTAILETYLIPHYGSLRIAHDVLGKIAPGPLNLRFATEPAEDQAIKLRFGCRLTEAALKSGQGVAAYAFLPVTMYMVQRLQQAGQTDRAVDYLSRTLALCGDMPYQEIINAKELLDRLQPGHPLAVGARLEVLQPPAKMRICLSLSSAGSDWLAKEHAQFERIYRTETGWVVLFSTGSQIGILELTPQFTAIREQHLKFTQPTSMRQSANPNDHGFKHWLFNRPVLTTDGDEVFVGFIDGAIIRFVSGMPPLRLRDTGGLSSQLIEHLAVLNHRLYAIVDSGGDDQNALEEIDTVTGASTILLSSRTKVPKNVIDGRPLRGLLADPAHHCLWLLVGSIYVPGNPNNQLVISEYDPMSGSVCLKDIPKLNECFFGDKIGTYLAHSDNVILMGGLVACKRLDTEANILSTTIVEGSDLSRRSPPITVGSNLIGVHKNQLIYYKADVCEPFYALDSGLTFATPPPKRRRPRLVIDGGVLCEALHGTKIRDLFSLGKDFLFLTDDAMWLVEMPTAIDGRPLESAAQSQ